ncbi:hypothetical protein BJ165DRAFT_1483111 [Panaeolus papilionaceus]|nr:hypothetical protein BJ165DRAFT_1483111 [Panaeolus papilionaceus]
MWLYGSAGAGKSAVAQTMCEELRGRFKLAASFFFSRTAPADRHRGHEGRFVTTIASQLTESIPGLRPYVEQVILTRPSVLDLTLKEQVLALIVDPLMQLKNDPRDDGNVSKPRIVIIDGLDECKEAGQQQVLEAIATLVEYQHIFPFSVFLSSRPDLIIRSWFAATGAKSPSVAQAVSLLDHCDSDHDIRVFMIDKAAEIRQSHPFFDQLPVGWPSLVSVNEVVQRASGQFIYASTVMKYISDPRHYPNRRLDSILQNKVPSDDRPYAELDALYLHILRQTKHPELVRQTLAFRIVTIAFCGILSEADSKVNLQTFLSLPYSVDTIFIDLQSILDSKCDGMVFWDGAFEDPMSDATCLGVPVPVVFYHRSLLEFLLSPQRSEEFYVDIPRVDKELCGIALDRIRTLSASRDASHKDHIKYCLLILLQAQTSRQPFYRAQTSTTLSRCDTLHKDMLFDILQILRLKTIEWKGENTTVRTVDIIDRSLWKVFAPAVTRRRAECHRHFEHINLPRELLFMSDRTIFGIFGFPWKVNHNLPARACLGQLLSWHILTSLQQETKADLWNLIVNSPPDTLRSYDHKIWVDFMDVLDLELDGAEKESLRLPPNFRSNNLSESAAAVIFCMQKTISLFHPAYETSKPPEIRAVFDYLKTKGGNNWRAIAVACLLHEIQYFIWRNCPLSTGIVKILETIIQIFFPPHIVSSMEALSLPFDVSYPESQKGHQSSFSISSPCMLPRWYHTHIDFAPDSFYPRYREASWNLGHLHDYVRLYNIHNSIRPSLDDRRRQGARDLDTSGTPACELADRTTDPETGLAIDFVKWSFSYRIHKFTEECEYAERRGKGGEE